MSLQAVKNRAARTAVDRVLRVCVRACVVRARCAYVFIHIYCMCVFICTADKWWA